jgi:endonuclease/exonuclease/phosphatase family metal-dependent hydrolase
MVKLISLNVWGGFAGREKLLDFFTSHNDVDIFCLQEVWNGGHEMIGRTAGGRSLSGIAHWLLTDIGATLPDHVAYFRPQFKEYYGLTMFIKKNIPIREEGELFVYKNRGYFSEVDIGDHSRNVQYMSIDSGDGVRAIAHVHGLWNGQGKGDSTDRLLQSDNIVRFLRGVGSPYIFCGDLNLLPDTESLKKIEAAGGRNLIKEFGITSTRSSLYTKPVRFADYIFVSAGIEVKDFKVLPDEVSDHLALYLEFS